MKRTEVDRMGGCGEQVPLSGGASPAGHTSRSLPCLIPLLISSVILGTTISASAGQYTAYSLKVAQQRIEQAGGDWRQKEPEVASLGGINKVEGFVFDIAAKDLVLVGQREQDRAALTLDDLVVALRGRFRYNEWPLVSIDPTPDTEKTQMQHVRFEGGIQDTAFGEAMFDADYRLKELSMGLVEPGISSFQTAWDRNVEETESVTMPGQRQIKSRFWFYPINPHVVVREGVCVVRGLKVGVFTEVLSAKIDGKLVEDTNVFKDATSDAFANDVSQRFDDLCQAQPSFNRLRGLQEVVAISKALEDLEERPDLSYWLEKYLLAGKPTQNEVKILRRKYESNRARLEVSGGVHLTALAMRLNAGDVTALRDAVLKVRSSSDVLSWGFVAAEWLIPIGAEQSKLEDIAPLFSQALFLNGQERHADSLPIYDEILKLNAQYVEAWCNKGLALKELGRTDEGLKCYDRAIELNPRFAEAWSNKGSALVELGRTDEGLKCCNCAIEINPRFAEAWSNKGFALGELGQTEEALKCFDHAIEINPRDAGAWCNKGFALGEMGRTEAWYNRGVTLKELGRADGQLKCYDRAIELNPRLAEAWYNKGVALGELGRTDEELKCYDRVIEINPRFARAWHNEGVALYYLKRYSEARQALEEAAKLGNLRAAQALEVLKQEGH